MFPWVHSLWSLYAQSTTYTALQRQRRLTQRASGTTFYVVDLAVLSHDTAMWCALSPGSVLVDFPRCYMFPYGLSPAYHHQHGPCHGLCTDERTRLSACSRLNTIAGIGDMLIKTPLYLCTCTPCHTWCKLTGPA